MSYYIPVKQNAGEAEITPVTGTFETQQERAEWVLVHQIFEDVREAIKSGGEESWFVDFLIAYGGRDLQACWDAAVGEQGEIRYAQAFGYNLQVIRVGES